jgi:hypothetical protein
VFALEKLSMIMETTRMNLNVNYSEDKIINNKRFMRLSKLQKWILIFVEKKPFEEAKALTMMVNDFSPKIYFWLHRSTIIQNYFDHSNILGSNPREKRIAEVVLTRSLETMEKNGLIVRVAMFRDNRFRFRALLGGMHGESEEEIREAVKDIDPKAEFSCYMRVDDGSNTKGIFLTDKGIEVRQALIQKLKLKLD